MVNQTCLFFLSTQMKTRAEINAKKNLWCWCLEFSIAQYAEKRIFPCFFCLRAQGLNNGWKFRWNFKTIWFSIFTYPTNPLIGAVGIHDTLIYFLWFYNLNQKKIGSLHGLKPSKGKLTESDTASCVCSCKFNFVILHSLIQNFHSKNSKLKKNCLGLLSTVHISAHCGASLTTITTATFGSSNYQYC